MRNRLPSRPISESDVPAIWHRIQAGEFLNRIAADYDVNPGRISEIKSGKKFASVTRRLAEEAIWTM